MDIVPITLKQAKEFIKQHHRHNKPPIGWKFGVGLEQGDCLIGVATAGRPISRMLDNKYTLEINRTCTNGSKNANSKLYAAIIRCARAMGYKRVITYTQSSETGSSLKAVNMREVKKLPARGSWADSSKKLKHRRCSVGNGGVDRVLWEKLL